jgi:CheY-like chemotaxis protein
MGGTLEVASTVGRGSTFSFGVTLPVLAAPAVTTDTPSVTGYDGPPRRVLIVDDHAVNRGLLLDLLDPLGFDCGLATGGEEALERLTSGIEPWPDLAIVDLRMDGMDGLELTRRLRMQSRGANLRVLLTSASVLNFDPAAARAAGCDEFLPKPFRTSDLVGKIGQLLALTWHHAATAPRDVSAPAAAASLPAAARQQLRDVLAAGDLDAFRAAVQRVRAAHPAAAAFCEQLDAAAAGFQLPRLRSLLD